MDYVREIAEADANVLRNAIVDMLQEINNPEYLRRIYFFSKVKYDREKGHSERRQKAGVHM